MSTRKVDRLVEQLGIDGMTKDRVSAICRSLDERVDAFCQRPLEGSYPYLWLDAKHVKVRDHGRVVSKALVVAYAVHDTRVREVIGLDIGEVESGAFWVEFLRSLKKRGLDGVRLAISDQHEGLKHAVARVLGCPWQRGTVHFTRDMVMHCRRDQRNLVAAALREIFQAENGQAAKARVTSVLEGLHPVAPKVCELLEAAEDDLIGFYAFPRHELSADRGLRSLLTVQSIGQAALAGAWVVAGVEIGEALQNALASPLDRAGADPQRSGDVIARDAFQQHRDDRSIAIVYAIQEGAHFI